MNFVHLNYHYHKEYTSPGEVIKKHLFANSFIQHLNREVNLFSIKHANYSGACESEGIKYSFFRSRNISWYIPFATHRHIKNLDPDVILVEGLVFPLQLIFLRRAVGKKCIIINQHRGELPFLGLKRYLQKLADNCIDCYVFTSTGNASTWFDKRIIKSQGKCATVVSSTSSFHGIDKKQARSRLGIAAGTMFLWVGRLNENKDPFTVIKAFEKYLSTYPGSNLYMIYQEQELLPLIQVYLNDRPALASNVHLVCRVEHAQLENWYSATDHFIAASRREAAGFAVVEAMSCGCVPILSNIAPFQEIIENGKYGYLFQQGKSESLCDMMIKAACNNNDILREKVKEYAQLRFSSATYAEELMKLCNRFLHQ